MIAAILFTLLALAQAAATSTTQVTLAAGRSSPRPGDVMLLEIRTPAPATSVTVRAFDHAWLPFRIDARTWQVIIGVDLDVTPGPRQVSVEVDSGSGGRASYDITVARRTFPTRRLKVDEAFVNPPASAAERIASDARDLERCWREAAAERLWTAPFARPVPHQANSAFGTRSIFNGQPRNAHSGADFLSPAGTPVKAPNAGRVVLAKDLYYSGGTVVIDHGLGLFSMMAHLSAIDVTAGASVNAGDVVGRVGATGRVTGPHLHWTVRLGRARVDPIEVLRVLGPAGR